MEVNTLKYYDKRNNKYLKNYMEAYKRDKNYGLRGAIQILLLQL